MNAPLFRLLLIVCVSFACNTQALAVDSAVNASQDNTAEQHENLSNSDKPQNSKEESQVIEGETELEEEEEPDCD